MMNNETYGRELISVLKEIAREMKSINKNLEVITQGIKQKTIKENNTLIKG